MRIIAALFGFVTGAVCGFALVWLLPGWFRAPLNQAIGGAVVGGVFGAIIGSISGEANAAMDAGSSHRIIIAFVFGAIGGYMGATRLEHLWQVLRYYHIQPPF